MSRAWEKTERPRLDLRPQLGEPRCQLSRQRYQIANSARDESAMLAYQAGAEQVMFESAENQSDM
jgi:hypothetical protein